MDEFLRKDKETYKFIFKEKKDKSPKKGKKATKIKTAGTVE